MDKKGRLNIGSRWTSRVGGIGGVGGVVRWVD